MVQPGRDNTLTILRHTPQGVYLGTDDAPEDDTGILLPRRYVTAEMEPGDRVEVFVYKDSEGRPVATTQTPHVQAGECERLRVLEAAPGIGLVLDWGLRKDLLLPVSEAGERRLRPGDWVVVAVYVDQADRIVASTRIDRHLSDTPHAYPPNEPVDALIYGESPLGYKAVVNRTHGGLLYRSETADAPQIGDRLTAYVKDVYTDGKIDLRRDPAGYGRVEPIGQAILDALDAAGGSLPFNDKSPPEAIRHRFNTSKKAFKQALGSLYKQRRIRFIDGGIERTGPQNSD